MKLNFNFQPWSGKAGKTTPAPTQKEASSESFGSNLLTDTVQFLDGAVPVTGDIQNHRTYKRELARATDESGRITDSSRYLRASSGRDANVVGTLMTGIGLATAVIGSGGLFAVTGLAAVAAGAGMLAWSGIEHAAAKPN